MGGCGGAEQCERSQQGYKQPLRSLPLESNTGHYNLNLKTEPGYKYQLEEAEERGERDMIDNMMSYGLPGHSQQTAVSQDSLARISSMTNSISPPLNSHGSMSPGKRRMLNVRHVVTNESYHCLSFTC